MIRKLVVGAVVAFCLMVCGQAVAAPPTPLPPDLPLAASPPNDAAWLRTTNMLQPDGHSQFLALSAPGDRPARVKREFGFNAYIVLPPDAHNAVTPDKYHLTEAQFRAGMAAYRAAGYRFVLYNSLMALGCEPEFQSGRVGRAHPDWLQRDPKGNPVMDYGVPWLCPNTGARAAALERSIHLVKQFQPDGIMLDNNEFYFAKAGWTCHCDGCTRAFRDYVRRRCGVEKTRELFGVAPEELKIPTAEGPLHALWLHWRNRVWAEVNETFRARLREVNPKILFFANTQYYFKDGLLAADLQYAREDIVISESVGLDSWQMSAKMTLGHAITTGRSLWNYIGTFTNGTDYTGLKPAAVIGPLISSTLAHAARPWIVDGFDLGATDPVARKEMARLLGWHAAHQALYSEPAWAGIGTVFSLTSRDVLHRPLIPAHLPVLQSHGTPVIGLRDDELSAESLRQLKVVIVETAGILTDNAARILAEWVREGGVLVAGRDVGTFDDLGRQRGHSVLWQALGLGHVPDGETTVGRGQVVAPEPAHFAEAAVRMTQQVSFRTPTDAAVEVVAYRSATALLLHIVRHAPTGRPVTLHVPEGFRPAGRTAELFVPGDEVRAVGLSQNADGASVSLTGADSYCVLRIPLQ